MKLENIGRRFTVCKLKDLSQVDFSREFCFLGRTDEEISLVCETDAVPANAIVREDGWSAFRISGTLDFSLVGILAKISAALAENQIGIFAVSTYNTDYILTKEADFGKAMEVLSAKGYDVI